MSLKVQVVETATEEVVKEVDVTGESKRRAMKVEAGLNRNLNHDKYHTQMMHNPVS